MDKPSQPQISSSVPPSSAPPIQIPAPKSDSAAGWHYCDAADGRVLPVARAQSDGCVLPDACALPPEDIRMAIEDLLSDTARNIDETGKFDIEIVP